MGHRLFPRPRRPPCFVRVSPSLSQEPAQGTSLVPAGYQALTGPLHEHSGHSDGWLGSTPATYFASAKKFGNDFLMAGEHSDTLDAPIAASQECGGPGVTGCLLADPDPGKSLRKWDAMEGYATAAPAYAASSGPATASVISMSTSPAT